MKKAWFKRCSLAQIACGVCFFAVMGAMLVRAADAEAIAVAVGKMEVVTIPFAVEGFRVADPSVAKIETVDAQRLRIVGTAVGTTDLQVSGQGGGSALYTVTVIENINSVLAAVKRDLDALPELDVGINLGRILVKGEVSNIDHWNYLQKILSLYKGVVVNLASFQPSPEVMLSLKSALEKAGLKVVGPEVAASDIKPGTISLKLSGNTIFVTGQVYSQKERDLIDRVIDAQHWIVVRQVNAPAKDGDTQAQPATQNKKRIEEGAVNAVLDIMMVPSMIEMDVIFVGVTDEEEKQIGVNLAKAGLIAVDSASAAFQGNLDSRSSGFAGTYSINSGLQGALTFFAGTGPGRFQTAGHMTFKNDSPEWRTYHSGGTLKVRIVSENTAEIEDIDYGLLMKVKGGLMDAKTVAVDLALELSYPLPIGTDWDLKRDRVETTINCPLGQTMIVGGMKSLLENSTHAGVPYLRSVPVLSWMFAEDNSTRGDKKVLILVSPHLAGQTTAGTPVVQSTAPVLQESEKSTDERKVEKRKRRFFFF